MNLSVQLPVRQIRHIIPFVQGTMVVAFLSLFLVMSEPEWLKPYMPVQALSYLARQLIWTFWFPLTLLSVIVAGRAWCGTMCPMGALSELAGRYGFRRSLPEWFKSPALPLTTFVVVTVLGQVMGVRKSAHDTVLLLGSIMVCAILIGFLYGRGRNRPWCRHACPIGMLLGLYGRLGAVNFHSLTGGHGQHEAYAERGACPTMIDLSEKKSARHCIECMRCVDGANAPCAVALRVPGVEVENIKNHGADKWEVFGLFLGDGIALGGFLWLVLPQYRLLLSWVKSFVPPVEQWPLWLMDSALFPWLVQHSPSHFVEGVSIALFMVGSMIVVGSILAGLTFIASVIARPTPQHSLGWTMTMMGYQIAPLALISLMLGLGGELLDFGIPAVRIGLFVAGGLWSLWLGWRIMANMDTPKPRRLLALVPRLVSVVLLALLWLPALGFADEAVEAWAWRAMPTLSHPLPHLVSGKY